MNETARDFLTRCFAPGDTIALLLRNESTATTRQRIVALEQALAPRYIAWLARENRHGANIYAAANPLRPGSRKYDSTKTNTEVTIWEIRVNSILKLDRAQKAAADDEDECTEEEAA